MARESEHDDYSGGHPISWERLGNQKLKISFESLVFGYLKLK